MNILIFSVAIVCGFCVANATYTLCPAGWKYCKSLRKCYFFSNYRLNWQNAKCQCENKYKGLLVRPLNSRENEFLKKQARSLVTRRDDGYWTGGNKCYKGWGWVGPAKKFTAIRWFDWGPHEPNNLGGNQKCIQLFCHHNFAWDDENCSRDKYFICERPMIGSIHIPPPVAPCPYGWKFYANYCFYFSSGQTVSWDSAKIQCKGKGAILAEPKTKSLNDFLKRTATSLLRIGSDVGYWFGARRCSSGYSFLWNSKHDPVIWNDWAKGEPNNYKNNKEDCAHLWCHRKFQWNDAPCAIKKHFICQKKRKYGLYG